MSGHSGTFHTFLLEWLSPEPGRASWGIAPSLRSRRPGCVWKSRVTLALKKTCLNVAFKLHIIVASLGISPCVILCLVTVLYILTLYYNCTCGHDVQALSACPSSFHVTPKPIGAIQCSRRSIPSSISPSDPTPDPTNYLSRIPM